MQEIIIYSSLKIKFEYGSFNENFQMFFNLVRGLKKNK